MRLAGRQLRFTLGTLGGWAGLRTALLWAGGGAGVGMVATQAPHRLPRALTEALDAPVTEPAVVADMSRAIGSGRRLQSSSFRSAAPAGRMASPAPPMPAHPVIAPGPRPEAERKAGREPLPEQALTARPSSSASRLTGTAYVFIRPGGGRASLAAGGQLGGSQAAARLAYRLNASGPVRTAAAVRLYAPLHAKGAEAAAGLDWYPFAGVPLRISVERRFDLDGAGRNAWSAYAAGGFYLERLDGRIAVDGYGQSGVVGAERHDLFVDAALRAGRRWRVGEGSVIAGAGVWGAAQPGVSRLDVGPRLGGVLPVGRHDVTLSLEGRLRVAGRAAPGSGAALTLGFDL